MDLVSSLLGILQKPPIGDAIIEMMSFMAPIWIAIVVGGAGGLVMEALLAKLETWNSEAKLEITSADTISTLERRRRTCTGGYFEKDEGRIVLKYEESQLLNAFLYHKIRCCKTGTALFQEDIYHQTTAMDKRRQVKNFAFTHSKDSKVKLFTIRGYVAEMKKKNPELCSPFAPMPMKEKNPIDEKQPTQPEKPAASEIQIVLKKA
nr:StAR-related lipid transfer protein 7, mitochondrial [Ipomoea batatas]